MSVPTLDEQRDEIEQDRAIERGVIWKALGALAIVAAFVVVRTLIVG